MPPTPSAETPPVVVKLGGSVITRKREVERLRPKVLARLAREVAGCRDRPVVLLHGAGSFGHPGAVRFGLATPPSGPEDHRGARRLRGAAIVSASVRRLHDRVLTALLEAGASPLSIPVQSHARMQAQHLVELDDRPFRSALASGGLPVSFGDVVPDSAWGFSILSADTIAVELARRLGASRVLFVSDVEGIYARDPEGRRAVVPVVTPEVVASLAPRPGVADVTGGIRGKAEAMLDVARAHADAGLISGLKDGALSRALRGERVYGSWCPAAPG